VTCLRRGEIFKHEFVTNLLPSPPVKLSARVLCLVFVTYGVFIFRYVQSLLLGYRYFLFYCFILLFYFIKYEMLSQAYYAIFTHSPCCDAER